MNFEEIRTTPIGDDPGPDRELDPELHAALVSWRDSKLHESEAMLAAIGECPTPEEVLALESGEIGDAGRRNALARHLIACPRCAAQQLHALSFGITPARGSSNVGSRRAQFAAAAVVLFAFAAAMWSGIAPSSAPAQEIAARFTDAKGNSPRSPLATPARIEVRSPAAGWVSVLRLESSGAVVPERVEGDSLSAAVGVENVVLPLDRTLSVAPGASFLILFSASEPNAADLENRAQDALRGVPRPGDRSFRLIAR